MKDDKTNVADNTSATQWHPAFFGSLQIEFEKEADKLIFESEHQLSTKPMAIDVLIIKKATTAPIKKNIGRIFRKHNIIEYKSPDDYLSIDDFYKVYGYTCFYKSDTSTMDEIKITDITITFVSEGYPRNLIEHLKKVKKYEISKYENGIYYVKGDIMPIQIIVKKRLSNHSNLWLTSLTNKLNHAELAKKLLKEYNEHRTNPLYRSVMNTIISTNSETFKEDQYMCQALDELLEYRFNQVENKLRKEAEDKIREETKKRLAEIEKQHVEMEKQHAEMKKQHAKMEKRNHNLILKLAELNRTEDIIKAVTDKTYQQQLFEEFGL